MPSLVSGKRLANWEPNPIPHGNNNKLIVATTSEQCKSFVICPYEIVFEDEIHVPVCRLAYLLLATIFD